MAQRSAVKGGLQAGYPSAGRGPVVSVTLARSEQSSSRRARASLGLLAIVSIGLLVHAQRPSSPALRSTSELDLYAEGDAETDVVVSNPAYPEPAAQVVQSPKAEPLALRTQPESEKELLPKLVTTTLRKTGRPAPKDKRLPKAAPATVRKGESDKAGVCKLKICTIHGPKAASLFVLETFDGVGHRIANMLNGVALANMLGMNFGGMVRNPSSKMLSDHGVHMGELLDGLFGQGAGEELIFRSDKYSSRSQEYNDLKVHRRFDWEGSEAKLREAAARLKPGAIAYVGIVALHAGKSLVGYFPNTLQAMLSEGLRARRLDFAPGRRSVAIHVRRGDIPKGDQRATSEAYYLNVAEVIRELDPNADVHVFSSTGAERRGDALWAKDDFEDFRSRGMQVHLDDQDILVPWAHMALADVFVTAMSFFSYTPALLNTNCIIYPGSIAHPGHRAAVPENWIDSLDVEGLDAKPHKVRRRDRFPGFSEEDGLEEMPFDDPEPSDDQQGGKGGVPIAIFKEKLSRCLQRVDADRAASP